MVGLTEEREKKVKENDKTVLDGGRYEMEERMKAEEMKSVSRLIIFSHEPFSTPRIVAAIRCLLDGTALHGQIQIRLIMGDFESDVRDACWLSLSSQKFRHAKMTVNLVLAQGPGELSSFARLADPPLHNIILLFS